MKDGKFKINKIVFYFWRSCVIRYCNVLRVGIDRRLILKSKIVIMLLILNLSIFVVGDEIVLG